MTAMDWRDYAACEGTDLYTWYSDNPQDQKVAKRVCAYCPVRATCLAEADQMENFAAGYGVWGGLTGRERVERRRRIAPPEATHCRNGHEWKPETTGVGSKGYRMCLECARAREERGSH